MKSREDIRWERLQQMLGADAAGENPKPVVSMRTLFGIPSSVEQAVATIVEEDEAKRKAQRAQRQQEQAAAEAVMPEQQAEESGVHADEGLQNAAAE